MTKIMLSNLKEGFLLFIAQILSFTFISINYRALAQANYLYAMLSDVLIALLSFFIIKRVALSKSTTSHWLGYTLGSVFGTFIGIFISKLILGG